jgi:predicted Zn-dependent peptidase
MTHSLEYPAEHGHHDADNTDVLGFWMYIMTDCVLFATLFAGFAVLHNNTYGGPPLKQLINLPYVLGETLFLLFSNLTFGFCMSVPHSLTEQEQDALHCLNHILTGTMHSRIFGAARRKGLAYGVGSYALSNKFHSSWDITGQVNHETMPEVVDIIVREMKCVLNGDIRPEELEVAKSFALGRYQMGAQTVSQISSFYNSRYFMDDHIKDYEKVPDTINNVTMDQMIDAARGFISNDIWALAAVSSGDRDELMPMNDKLATLFEPS